MRIAPGQVAGILRDTASVSLILLHGEDLGLIRNRSTQVARSVLGGQDDPFRLSILARHEHDRLFSEAQSPSLTGGRRVVRVLDASDHLVAGLLRLDGKEFDVLLILEGGALSSRSKLRTAAEKHSHWVSIACQPATPSAIISDLQMVVQKAGCSISSDAVQTLAATLPADTAARMSELDKLITYVGSGGIIDVDAAAVCANDGHETPLFALFERVMVGDEEATDHLVQRALDDGLSGPGLIVAFGSYIQRLLKVRLLMNDGMTMERACGTLFPPVMPRQVASWHRQLSGWSERALMRLLSELKNADIACKRAASRDDTIAACLVLKACRQIAMTSR